MTISTPALSAIPGLIGLPSGTTVSLTGDAASYAFSDSSLASFGTTISEGFLIVSSGVAVQVPNANTSGSQGTDLGPLGVDGDTIVLTFEIPLPAAATSISFDFTFLSEEFPEFVGSTFNDFLSIKLNGTELALDTLNQPITVNNNFFDGSLTPVGTFFDGQTPPLTITAPLDTDANTATLEISIGDVGDGIYDSAGFIGDFNFAQSQIVFVDFDGGTIIWEDNGAWWEPTAEGSQSITLPGSSLSASEQEDILDKLNEIYSKYQIEFVDEAPETGTFSTVLVGGTEEDLPDFFGIDPNDAFTLLGTAEKIDYGNQDKGDSAFALAGEISDNDLLAQVIAHEVGHILGLRHIDDEDQLMYPFADKDATEIGGSANLAEIVNGVVTAQGGTQDSDAELTRNLGLKEGSGLLASESFVDQLLKFFSFDLFSSTPQNEGSESPTVFDAQVIVASAEGLVMQVIQLGDVKDSVGFVAPAVDGDKVVILGKSTEDGPYDLIFNDGSFGSIDFDALGQAGIVDNASIEVSMLSDDDSDLNFGVISSTGTIEEGFLQAQVEVLSLEDLDGNATSGDDNIVGTDGDDTIVALGGDDVVFGADGNDFIFGSDGDDDLSGGDGNDTIQGAAGNDTIAGDAGNDEMTGGSGADSFEVSIGSGNSTITDFSGTDGDMLDASSLTDFQFNGLAQSTTGGDRVITLTDGSTLTIQGAGANSGPTGSVSINGTPTVGSTLQANVSSLGDADGLGEFEYQWLADGVAILGAMSSTYTVNPLDAGKAISVQVSYIDKLLTSESVTSAPTANATGLGATITGTANADQLGGTGGNDRIEALGGNDVAFGGSGNDLVNGGAGADSIFGGAGNDGLLGGAGDDLIGGFTGNDVIYTGAGNDAAYGGVGNDSMSGFTGNDELGGFEGNDFLNGGDGNDLLWGSFGNDELLGGDGADVLGGFSGNDMLFGEGGGDEMWGSTGNDTMDGGFGSDTMGGGTDDDMMYGNGGNDQIFGGTGNDTIMGEAGNDTIFGAAGNDVLDGGIGDDLLYSGPGTDVIVFSDGNDSIAAFTNGEDQIDMSGSSEITDIADLLSNHVSNGTATIPGFTTAQSGVVINDGSGNTLFVLGVSTDDLDATDFIF